jgi:uncharacterized protein YjiK
VLNSRPVVVEMTLAGEILRRIEVLGAQDLEGPWAGRDGFIS